jgi:hypothetical protein
VPCEVEVAGLVELLLLGLAEKRVEEVVCLLFRDRIGLDWMELAPDAIGRRDAHLDVQVGCIEPAHGGEKLLDVQGAVDHRCQPPSIEQPP